jgi:hypothetical protein
VTGQNEDALWQEIVANYGDRPVLENDTEPAPPITAPTPDPAPMSAEPFEVVDRDEWLDESFVPPAPPPLPRVPKDRLAAWTGVFASPILLLLATVLQIHLPTMVAWLLVCSFLGGFGYLVAQMPRGPRDPFDDGARL